MIDVDLPLGELLLPGGVPEIEGNPLPADAAHAFADYFTMLAVGCYDVTTTPITVDGVVCLPAHLAGVVVLEGETTEVFLLNQCDGDGAGAIDVLGAANHPPVLLEVAFATSKLELVCTDQVVCATAQDPESDPIEFVWMWLGGVAIVGGPQVDSLSVNDDGSTTECVRFFSEAPGRTSLSVTVYDLLETNGVPQRVEDWLGAQGYPSDSHASLEFPSYAIACPAGEECVAGECAAVGEGCVDECVAGAGGCVGDTVVQCEAGPLGCTVWVLAWDCAGAGEVCIDAMCQPAPAVCGDDIVQAELGETCDDGNVVDGDGCSAMCMVETRCDQAVVALEGVQQGTTSGDDLERGSCGGGGPEQVWEFVAPRAAAWLFSAAGSAFDTLVYARSECGNPDSELACDDTSFPHDELLIPLDEGDRIFVFMDGWSVAGDYVLTITAQP